MFGDAGTNGQHAFFQLLHQGTDVIPVDFIAVRQGDEGPPAAQAMLLANAVAQAEALMVGRTEADVRAELAARGPGRGVAAPSGPFPATGPRASSCWTA